MINIKTKYLILIWIIILILFTFYCIFRLYYLKEKYETVSLLNLPSSRQSASQLSLQSQSQNTSPNIINYINNIETSNNITDVPGCENVYDDNIAVQTLGYNSCSNAYADYLAKSLDINKKYGQLKSLADMCPVSAKTPMYSQCLQTLLQKYTNTANIVDNITTDMQNSINSRIQYRTSALDDIQNELNPLMLNKDQNDFKQYMILNGQVAKYSEDTIGIVDNYYKKKYSEGFVGSVSTYIVDPSLESKFFGSYNPINGQYIAFNDLVVSLGYDTSSNQSANRSQINEVKPIILTISSKSNNLKIIYNIVKIDNYKAMKNAMIMSLSSQDIINQQADYQTIQQLLTVLGITAPTQLIMVYDEFTSSENIIHKSYKLSNINLDTIMVLNKN